jgi:mannose-1-phosphate guanylyltransferase
MDVGIDSFAVKVALNPGHGMNFHSHDRRDEGWTVISGSGRVVIDGEERLVSAGDMIDLPIGCKHTVSASSIGLQIIEVQMGEEISVRDKKKWELK